ncbi:MAG TPA: aldose epimerase [Cyanothece sp. UBA12306]|nr:aldose epimerase [Cyanothece sp. UBA12306]
MTFSVAFKQEQYLTYILEDSEATSSVEVVPERGGIITRWKLKGQDIFYLDEERFTHPELSVRGGVPILFPICGNLPDDTYAHLGKSYKLKQHGFARNLPWEVTNQGTDDSASLTVTLSNNDQTFQDYPFEFQVDFTYELKGNSLAIRQKYQNKSDKKMPFSFGFHPYFLLLDKSQVTFNIPGTEYEVNPSKEIHPYHGTFDFNQDEIDAAFKALTGASATMTDNQRNLKLTLSWSDIYSTFVFWTVKGKDFVCLEPWSAPRNSLNTGENLTQVPPGETCEAVFEMKVDSI